MSTPAKPNILLRPCGLGLPAKLTEARSRRRSAVEEQGDALLSAIDTLLSAQAGHPGLVTSTPH